MHEKKLDDLEHVNGSVCQKLVGKRVERTHRYSNDRPNVYT
jgi:hypothetical protein